jgi:hypothetical protein
MKGARSSITGLQTYELLTCIMNYSEKQAYQNEFLTITLLDEFKRVTWETTHRSITLRDYQYHLDKFCKKFVKKRLDDVFAVSKAVIPAITLFDTLIKKKKPLLQAPANDVSYEAFLKRERKKYTQHSIHVENRAKRFKEERICIYNTKTGEVYPAKHKPQEQNHDVYLKNMFKAIQLMDYAEEEGLAPIFVTVTLPSEFHPYIRFKNGKELKHPKRNPKYDRDLTIHDGHERIQEWSRAIMKAKRKRIVKYIRAQEPHKTGVLHAHYLFFVEAEYRDAFIDMINEKRVEHSLGDEFDTEIIEEASKSVAYITKYVKKSLNPEDEETFHYINGWKKHNKVRMFTMSNIGIPNYILTPFLRTVKPSYTVGENIADVAQRLMNLNIQRIQSDETPVQKRAKIDDMLVFGHTSYQRVVKRSKKSYKGSKKVIRLNNRYDVDIVIVKSSRKKMKKDIDALVNELDLFINVPNDDLYNRLASNPYMYRSFFAIFGRAGASTLYEPLSELMSDEWEIAPFIFDRKKRPKRTSQAHKTLFDFLKRKRFLRERYIGIFRQWLIAQKESYENVYCSKMTDMTIGKGNNILYNKRDYACVI